MTGARWKTSATEQATNMMEFSAQSRADDKSQLSPQSSEPIDGQPAIEGRASGIEDRRLVTALAESVARMANRYKIPGSDMDYLAVNTVVGEWLRRHDPAAIKELYAAGYALGLRLAAAIGPDEPAPADIANLHRLPATIPGSINEYSSAAELLARLRCLLSSLVSKSSYPSDSGGKLNDLVFSLCKWEGDLLKLPGPSIARTECGHDPRKMLEISARKQGGVFEGAKVLEHTTLIGGFANETTLFELADKYGRIWDLVARASVELELGIDGRDIEAEFYLIRYLYQSGVSVAEPIWVETDTEYQGLKFLVTRRVEGDNFGTVVHARPLSSAQIKSLATELAKIHSLSIDRMHPDLRSSHLDMRLAGVSTTDAVSDYLERWIRLWRSTALDNSPTVEATLKWLRANLPQIEDTPVLVHGDYGVHNILIQGDEIGGVIDWEMSHLGDAAEDITWLLSSFQGDTETDEFWRYYTEAGGSSVSDFQLKYYRVFGYFKMYVVMLESRLRFGTLPETHPKLLVLGNNFIQTPATEMAKALESAMEK